MNVLVYDRNKNNNINEKIIKSKDTICPKYDELGLINLK